MTYIVTGLRYIDHDTIRVHAHLAEDIDAEKAPLTLYTNDKQISLGDIVEMEVNFRE